MEDFTAIAPYKEGKITKEEAAERLGCSVDYLDDHIKYIEGDGISNHEYWRREQERRYGPRWLSDMDADEERERRESPLNCGRR